MSSQTASFKVTLVSQGQKLETRRFSLPRNNLSSYINLRNKLNVVFQSIQGNPFKITWKDSDGDDILISSDEELMIAVEELEEDVYRLTAEILETQTIERVNGGSVHSSVLCDGCNGEISGFRYACVQCPNYDLCPKCEMSEHHPEHFMVRIPFPMQRRGVCGKHGERCACEHFLCEVGDSGCPAGHTYKIPQFLLRLFGTDGSHREGGKEKQGRIKYLRSIGETVASLLDPLGIDVDIKADTKENGQEVTDRKSPPCCHGAKSSDEEMVNEEHSVAVLEQVECQGKATSDEKENSVVHYPGLKLTEGSNLLKMSEPMHPPIPSSQDMW